MKLSINDLVNICIRPWLFKHHGGYFFQRVREKKTIFCGNNISFIFYQLKFLFLRLFRDATIKHIKSKKSGITEIFRIDTLTLVFLDLIYMNKLTESFKEMKKFNGCVHHGVAPTLAKIKISKNVPDRLVET